MCILALLHFVPLLGHVQLHVAEMRLEEPRQPLYAYPLRTLGPEVGVWVWVLRSMFVRMWVRRHCRRASSVHCWLVLEDETLTFD